MDAASETPWVVQTPGTADAEFDCLYAMLLSAGDGSTQPLTTSANSVKPSEVTVADDVDDWLFESCLQHIAASASALDADQLSSEVRAICTNTKSEDELQMKLFDLIGETGFDLICGIMGRVEELRQPAKKIRKVAMRQPTSNGNAAAPGQANSSGFVVMTASEKQSSSQSKKKEIRDKNRRNKYGESDEIDWLEEAGFEESYLQQERLLGLQGGSLQSSSTFTGDNSWMDGLQREHHDKVGLPAGTTRKTTPGTEVVFMPAPPKPAPLKSDELVAVSSLDSWAQLAFPDTERLNRIQSAVFKTAYNSAENMLVCAPTGAGKTNIAMLSLLQQIRRNISPSGVIDKSSWKAVYVAPMKALAQEVVTKFSQRLKPLGLVVREFTGDMNLTKQEIMDSQLIVTTPEKWDVVTRKGGDGSLGTMVTLIIIDEIHLLADDRGAVIETIVARTLRYVESSQQLVRLVGLSATLPNYMDVSNFLHVNPTTGCFFFGPEYRPVPLDLTFIGVTEKVKPKRDEQMNRSAYEKMIEALKNDKQVMIFVHSRKETSKTCQAMRDLCAKNATFNLLDTHEAEKYSYWNKKVDKAGLELQQLFAHGFGTHHAGMQRSDRTLTEQLFEFGIIKVLCCTATLAWGVNLPAHTVIIKGTELYDPERGGFVDVSILDILQIFGRAGRPQYDNTGHAILITPHKSLNNYLNLIGHQAPIESGLIKSLPDHINAEIVNGTINTIQEAVSWLSYTFLYVRMKQNPVAYGLKLEKLYEDPQLCEERLSLVTKAADILDRCMMTRYDNRSGNLGVTDLGRVASHYYIKYPTIEAFNTMLTPHLTDSEALHVLCSSAEFDQLKVRPEELSEIETLSKQAAVSIKAAQEDTAGKVSVLLQGYLKQCRVNSFTLQSDTNYVVQNAGRICRALFEICLKRGWQTMANHFLSLSKGIDRRMGESQTPLRQFNDELPDNVIKSIERANASIHQLFDMTPAEVGELCRNSRIGPKVLAFIRKLPYLEVEATVRPITRGIIRINLSISPAFEWTDRYHHGAEGFWVWVEDADSEYIYHSEYIVIGKRQMSEVSNMEITIPVQEPLPPQYYVRVVSDRWVGCESMTTISFKHLMLPDMHPVHTDLLDVHPIPVKALRNPTFESLYDRFDYFNPIQSQLFHVLYHTDNNVLVGAPTGSGKTITSEIAILRVLNNKASQKKMRESKNGEGDEGGPFNSVVVYIAPMKALARERMKDWRVRLGEKLKLSVVELTGDVTPDISVLKKADVIITTPEKWDGITRGWRQRDYAKSVALVIIDEIHLLGEERGPVLEVIVSRMRFINAQTSQNIRFIGLSTALANPRDLGDWLGISDVGLYNFRPSVRPIPMSIYIQGFPGKHYCPRMATMNKPAYASIMEHSPEKPVLIFVSSRRQTRLTALDLISYCAADEFPKKFLHMPEDEVSNIASTLRDRALRDTIIFGIGIHHAGLDDHDRTTVETLFVKGKIQILVCTSTLAWGVNFPAHLVIVKGTEYFDGKLKRYVDFPVTDVLQMMGRAGRPQFDDTGVSCVFVHEPKKNFYRKFLHEPFPLESSLHLQLHNHLNAEIAMGSVNNLTDCVEYLSWTFFFRRLIMNPSYYQLQEFTNEAVSEFLSNLIKGALGDLKDAGCISFDEEGDSLSSTPLGKIASTYYIDYQTAAFFQDQVTNLTHDEATVQNICFVLSHATEYSELPVRHCEDEMNAELATKLPWPLAEDENFESSHVKTFLLLQAHFNRISLPVTDYINDTKSVLDQMPRVLNSLLDIATLQHRFDIVRSLVRISQMIIQASAEDSNSLCQLPGLSEAGAGSREMSNRLRSGKDRGGKLNLAGLLKIPDKKVQSWVTDLVDSQSRAECLQVIQRLPRLALDYSLTKSNGSRSSASTEADVGSIDLNSSSKISSSDRLELRVYVKCEKGDPACRVYAPRINKPKKLSWWALVWSTDKNGRRDPVLLGIKRFEFRGSMMSLTIPFQLKDGSADDTDVFLEVVSDSVSDIGVTASIALE